MPITTSAGYQQASRQHSSNLSALFQAEKLAKMGAQQLSQYGPDGQAWAQRLVQNPQAALAMAQQYGGFQKIEDDLKGSIARGQAMQADNAPEAFSTLFKNSPREAVAYQQGRNLGAEADAFISKASANPFGYEQGFKLRGKYESGSEEFRTIKHFYEIAAANAAKAAENTGDPGAVDFALVQAYGKMLDPNSVVRNEEGKFIVESQSSGVADAINRFARLFSAKGTLNPQARLNLMRQIDATYQQAAKTQQSRLSEMNAELDRLGAEGIAREVALPIGIQLSPERLDIAPWEAMASVGMKPTDIPLGTRKTVIDNQTGEEIEVELVEDGWNRVR